jgi:hypothetical protein
MYMQQGFPQWLAPYDPPRFLSQPPLRRLPIGISIQNEVTPVLLRSAGGLFVVRYPVFVGLKCLTRLSVASER